MGKHSDNKWIMKEIIVISCVLVTLSIVLYNIIALKNKSITFLGVLLAALVLFMIYKYISKTIYAKIKFRKTITELHLSEANVDIYDLFEREDMGTIITEYMNAVERGVKNELKVELLTKQAEITSLQNQINPHFLYNTLEAIRSEMIISKNYRVAEMTETLAKYFRYNISQKSDFAKLRDELENIENYMKIQTYRFGDRIKYKVVIHDNDEAVLECMLPKLTLQPIVENAIYHGLEMKVDGGTVVIHITQTNKKILITVSDNGVGMDADQVEKLNEQMYRNKDVNVQTGDGVGIALININLRLKLLWGEEYGLHIYSTKGSGTDVEIAIPSLLDKG